MSQADFLDSHFAGRYGPWAVILGGSEGTGESFARFLAGCGINLLLVARREEPLRKLSRAIELEHGVEARWISVDLAREEGIQQVIVAAEGLEVGLMIYNAGTCIAYKRFIDWRPEELRHMINLNCHAPTMLAHHFAREMCARGAGGIMLLGSLAGMAGASYTTIYPATKAFDHILAEGLWHDLSSRGVDVLALILGATKTPSHAAVDFDNLHQTGGAPAAMDCDEVALEGLSHLGKEPVWVVGEENRAMLPPDFTESRPILIDAVSKAAAVMAGLEHVPPSSLQKN